MATRLGALVVPEVVLNDDEFGLPEPFRLNDRRKAELAVQQSNNGRIVVLDRFYVSTEAHAAAKARANARPVPHNDLKAYEYWSIPDAWIYIPATAEESFARYSAPDLDSEWASIEGVRHISHWMEQFFLSVDTPLFRFTLGGELGMMHLNIWLEETALTLVRTRR